MTRFHIRPEAVSGERVTFDVDETHHLSRVLRLGVGDLLRAVDGRGDELTVRLTTVTPRRAEGAILERIPLRTESPLHLTLVQGIPKGDKMDGIIRMATELGVTRIVPALTARAVVRVEGARAASRLARWQRVAREAAKQSGRAILPEVCSPQPLGSWLEEAGERGLLLCLWEGERTGLSRRLPASRPARATVVVGPEGGLAEVEVRALTAAGAMVASLGPRILRTETAGPVAIALLQARYGDLDGG